MRRQLKKNDLINDSKHTLPWQYGAEPVTVDDYCGTMCSIFISQTRHGRTPFAVFPKYSTRTRSSPVPLSCSFRLRLKKIKKNPSSLVTRGTRCQRSRTLSLSFSLLFICFRFTGMRTCWMERHVPISIEPFVTNELTNWWCCPCTNIRNIE